MNKHQGITLGIAIVNLLLVCLFPPFDYISPARSNVPTFDGFYPYFGEHGNRIINSSFLQLEIFVIGFNAAVAWFLLETRRRAKQTARIDWQKLVLFGVGLNLLLVLLFPPMENYYAVTRAALPSFDGFYFLFGEHGKRTIITAILYIEVVIILINGALLYLLFRSAKPAELTAEDRIRIAAELKRASGR